MKPPWLALLLGLSAWLGVSPARGQSLAFITNGLVMYYPFNGNADDASGNGYNGTVFGASPSPDRFDNPAGAYAFTSPTNYISVDNAPHPQGEVTLTYSCWVAFSGTNIPVETIINIGTDSGSGFFPNSQSGLAIVTPQPAGYPSYLAYVGGDNDFTPTQAVVTPGVWHQIALSKSGTNVATYADGALLASGSTRPGQDVASHKLFIGSNGNSLDHSGEPFQGLISDVRVYEVALSAGEVAELYQFENGQAGPSPAAATAQVVNGFVVGATVTAGGSGYTNPPDVSILGGGGAGATAVAVISNGVVSAITIEATGSGYTSEPSIVIAPPPYPPIEATGVAEVINGFVAGVTITGDGYGYGTNVPPVSFLGGDGSDAAGFATVQNGYVTAVTMTSTGSNYLTAPLVLIAAPPGVPSLGISRVTSAPAATVKIDLTLIPGYTYEFQTSTDGLTWSINGSAFLATNSAMSQLFNISTNVQLFELKQVSNR